MGVGEGNSEKVFHADSRRLETQMDAEKKSALIGERKIQKKDGFTQIFADWKRRWTQRIL
ncbi:hypothetical protein C0T31_09800 [Dysgonamonadaceae bacterium]|nr:hypothetical protein C0T31_09800 [Dysgonamonadaceae bacterium]